MNTQEHYSDFWHCPTPAVTSSGIFYNTAATANVNPISSTIGNSVIEQSSSYLTATVTAAGAVGPMESGNMRFQTFNSCQPFDAALAAFEQHQHQQQQQNNVLYMCADVCANSILGSNALSFSAPNHQNSHNIVTAASFSNFHQFQNTFFGQNFGLNQVSFPHTLHQLSINASSSNNSVQQHNPQSTFLPLSSLTAPKFTIDNSGNNGLRRTHLPPYNSLLKCDNILQSQQNSTTTMTPSISSNLIDLSNYTTNRQIQSDLQETLDHFKSQTTSNSSFSTSLKSEKMSPKLLDDNLLIAHLAPSESYVNGHSLKAIMNNIHNNRNIKDDDLLNENCSGENNILGKSSDSTNISNKQSPTCSACFSAQSNGLHFGARTCAACAAFFRRSISDGKHYVCKRSQRCVIKPGDTNGYRKMCRSCRMKRCLEIGMLPENVQNKRHRREFYFNEGLTNVSKHFPTITMESNNFQQNNFDLNIATQQHNHDNMRIKQNSFSEQYQRPCQNQFNKNALQRHHTIEKQNHKEKKNVIIPKLTMTSASNTSRKIENQHLFETKDLLLKSDAVSCSSAPVITLLDNAFKPIINSVTLLESNFIANQNLPTLFPQTIEQQKANQRQQKLVNIIQNQNQEQVIKHDDNNDKSNLKTAIPIQNLNKDNMTATMLSFWSKTKNRLPTQDQDIE